MKDRAWLRTWTKSHYLLRVPQETRTIQPTSFMHLPTIRMRQEFAAITSILVGPDQYAECRRSDSCLVQNGTKSFAPDNNRTQSGKFDASSGAGVQQRYPFLPNKLQECLIMVIYVWLLRWHRFIDNYGDD